MLIIRRLLGSRNSAGHPPVGIFFQFRCCLDGTTVVGKVCIGEESKAKQSLRGHM